MTPEENKAHWKSWADRPGALATTMSETIKKLEVDALWRRLKNLPVGTHVLEAGCGNGVNLIELEKLLVQFTFHGFDYVMEMVDAAIEGAAEAGIEANIKDSPLQFGLGDVLHMDRFRWLDDKYDVVFTDRCLINLDSWESQKRAIKALADKVHPGGMLMMIENCRDGREKQTEMLEALGYEGRGWPPFNLFMDKKKVLEYLWQIGMPVNDLEYFGSLHDLCLYVLAPALNGGVRDYDHPLVKIATELSLRMPRADFGSWGQNILFVCRRPA